MSPRFSRLWFATFAAQGAEQLALTALPLMAALALGAGAGEMGLLGAAQTLPWLILSLVAGILADRWPRRLLMAGAEGVRAILLLAFPVLILAGWGGLPTLGALGFCLSTSTVLFGVAAQAYLPGIVDRSDLPRANARLEFARAVTMTAGPGLAGLVVGWGSVELALGLSALTSGLACWLLAGRAMEPPPRVPAPHQALGRALAEGMAFAWRQPLLRAIVGCAMAWNLSWWVIQSVFVLYAFSRFGMDAQAIGVTLGAQGAGMLAGALAAPSIARRLRLGPMIVLGPALSAGAAMIMAGGAAVGPGIGMVLLLAAFFLFGFGPLLWVIGQTSLRQALVPDALIGRVSAVQQVATAGMRPLGALLGGAIGAAWGLDVAIMVGLAGFGLQLTIILLSPVPRLVDLPSAA